MAEKNVTIIYNLITGTPLMVITDANPSLLSFDPAFNPEGAVRIPVDVNLYNSMNQDQFQQYMTNAISADMATRAANEGD